VRSEELRTENNSPLLTPDSALLTPSKFEDNVSAFLNSCQKETPLLVAVSGGADSMAMLAALLAVCPKERLTCMHVEHGIRPAHESRGDADFVRAFCEERSIEFRVEHVPSGKAAAFARRKKTGIEAAARFFRHRALSRQRSLLGENALILLAHTKDDLLETALMRILRGAGPAGLSSMPAKRGRIMRPLLDMTRADVIGYLKAKGISWREDSTNTDKKFLRNRIRHQLVPLLDESFSSWRTGVVNMANTQTLAAEFITGEARTKIKWQVSSEDFVFTDFDNFLKQPLIIREEAVFQAINLLSSFRASVPFAPLREHLPDKSIKRSVVRRFCEGAVNAADLGSVKIRREKGKILVYKTKKEFFESGISRLIIE